MCSSGEESRIYVACLASYNNGILHGQWIDANQQPDEIYDEIRQMLAASPIAEAEEWAVHDYEGFGGQRLSEYEDIRRVSALAEFIAEHGALGSAMLDYYSDLDEACLVLEDRYCGEYRSAADYAEELTEQTGDVPEYLRLYIDYERMARDMELNGDILVLETGFEEIHVFHGG